MTSSVEHPTNEPNNEPAHEPTNGPMGKPRPPAARPPTTARDVSPRPRSRANDRFSGRHGATGGAPTTTGRRQVVQSIAAVGAGVALGTLFPEPRLAGATSGTGGLAPNGRDDTWALQQALDQTATVNLPAGHFQVGSVRLNSGNRLTMAPNTVLHSIPPERNDYRGVLLVQDVDDVVIEGGMIDGSGGPVMNGISIEGAHRLRIRDTQIVNMATTRDGVRGDGIYIRRGVAGKPLRFATDIVIEGVTADANGRQGLSLVSGRQIHILHCTFSNTTSAVPGAGIDFEPNVDNDTIDDVVVTGCTFEGNETGVLVFMKNAQRINNVTLRDCVFRANRANGITGRLDGVNGFAIVGCAFDGNAQKAVLLANAEAVIVVDNLIRNHPAGLGIEIENVRTWQVRGNDVRGCGHSGILVTNPGVLPSTGTLTENQVWDNGTAVAGTVGINLRSESSPLRAIVRDNWCGNTEPGGPQEKAIGTRGVGVEAGDPEQLARDNRRTNSS